MTWEERDQKYDELIERAIELADMFAQAGDYDFSRKYVRVADWLITRREALLKQERRRLDAAKNN